MNVNPQTELLIRDKILRLLSDDEIVRVSTAETSHLRAGDEYVDLEALHKGVRRARGDAFAPLGRILPRKALHPSAWRAIESLVSAYRDLVRAPSPRAASPHP